MDSWERYFEIQAGSLEKFERKTRFQSALYYEGTQKDSNTIRLWINGQSILDFVRSAFVSVNQRQNGSWVFQIRNYKLEIRNQDVEHKGGNTILLWMILDFVRSALVSVNQRQNGSWVFKLEIKNWKLEIRSFKSISSAPAW